MNEDNLQELETLFTDSPDSMLDPNMGTMFGGISVFTNILTLVVFLLKAWGLYNINKKLKEPYPWLSYIPIVQMYSFVKAGGKKGIWILWLILGTVLTIIGALLIIIFGFLILLYGGSIQIPLFTLGIILVIVGIIPSIHVIHCISKRTGRGIWTTLGLIFIAPIMYPIVGYKLEDTSYNPDIEAIRPKVPEAPKDIEEEL